MSLNPEKMLERCKDGQWNVDDFDWTLTPQVTLSKEDEMRICQLYLDMSYIEKIAGNLFQALSERMVDPVLKEIYHYCYLDEIRHSEAAARLSHYFDVHQYKVYTPNIAMLKFIPHFSNAVRTLNPAVANFFILTGELILDIALLRGINNYVDDPQSRAVVEKINQDESRHLAMDFFMAEYCSENHEMIKSGKQSGIINTSLIGMAAYGGNFFNEVFFRPMQILDPSNEQMESVARRIRRFNLRDEVKNNPAVKAFNVAAEFVLETKPGQAASWSVRKSIKQFTGINFDFILAASKKNIARDNSNYNPTATSTELADEIVGKVA